VACSTVFGGIAGDRMAAYLAGKNTPEVVDEQVQAVIAKIMAPFNCPSGEDVYVLRDDLRALMWEKAGLVRNASDLESAQRALAILCERACTSVSAAHHVSTPNGRNGWNLDSLLTVSNMIVASALQRKESRGAHFRSDYPKPITAIICKTSICSARGRECLWLAPVQFTRLPPPASHQAWNRPIWRRRENDAEPKFYAFLRHAPCLWKTRLPGDVDVVFQRASSLILMVLLPWHWVNPYSRPVRVAVLFFVIFHAAAGARHDP
jgi:hypothetical protein